jgi:hypothetical protein
MVVLGGTVRAFAAGPARMKAASSRSFHFVALATTASDAAVLDRVSASFNEVLLSTDRDRINLLNGRGWVKSLGS